MPVSIFNAFEVVIWGSMAAIVAWRFRRAGPSVLRLSRIAAICLALFAVSDVIEFHTGAWWRPPGLLLLKGACLAGLVWCGWQARRIRDASAVKSDKAESD